MSPKSENLENSVDLENETIRQQGHRREAAGDLLSEIEDENCSVGGRGADLVAAAVPADLEDAAGAFVRMNLQKRITMVKSY